MKKDQLKKECTCEGNPVKDESSSEVQYPCGCTWHDETQLLWCDNCSKPTSIGWESIPDDVICCVGDWCGLDDHKKLVHAFLAKELAAPSE